MNYNPKVTDYINNATEEQIATFSYLQTLPVANSNSITLLFLRSAYFFK